MSIASFRSLTVACFPAIMFVSLSQLAVASSFYSPTELSSRTTSGIFGAATAAPKSSSDYGTDVNFQMLSSLAATPGDAVDTAPAIGSENSPFTASNTSPGNAALSGAIVESVVEHSVSAEGLGTASELEAPSSFGVTPSGGFGTGIFGSAAGGMPVSDFGTSKMNGVTGGIGDSSPISLSFTTGVTSIPVRKTVSFQSAVPEPAGVGIAVAALVLMLGAFYRRRSVTPTP